jgi:hypothetical protein
VTREVRISAGTDADDYVPRLALESALAELAEATDKTPGCAALSGGVGLGKTLLLHVLRRRLHGAYECLYLPSPRLQAEEFWSWAAQALGLGSGEDDRGAVLGRASRLPDEGSGLVLLIDDAGLLPPATRADLLAALDTRGFTLILAFSSKDIAQLQSLPAFVHRIELGPPMTLTETRAYLHARLRQRDPEGSVAAGLNAERLAGFHDAAGGITARLNALLDAWLADSGWQPNHPARLRASAVTEARAREASAPQSRPELPEALRVWAERVRRPDVQLALMALFAAAILGSWLFAWRLNPGVNSVGVPVEALPPVSAPAETTPPVREPEAAPIEAEPETTAPETPPPGPEARSEAAPPKVEEAAATAVVQNPNRLVSSRRSYRSLAPPIPAAPPVRDAAVVEAPVEVASAKFPGEHVPRSLEEQPLAPPPSGPRLSVNAKPWASIRLDGTEVGETPLGELRLTPGSHVVSATLPDGRVVERRVEAKAGDLYLVFP